MPKGLNWLPCYRHRQERAEQKRLDELRREGEAQQKVDEDARRKEKKNGPNQPTVEQDPLLPSLSIHQQVWNEAFDTIAKDDPKLVEGYMKALKKSLRPEDAPDSEEPDVSAEMYDPVKREETMLKLVESGRRRAEKSAKATERLGAFADGILQCKSLVDLAISSVPQAAIPWAGVCIGLQVSTAL